MVAMTPKTHDSWARRWAKRRRWFQGGFLLIWLDPLLLRWHHICAPVLHCHSCPLATFACPIGVVAGFGALHLVPFFALGILLVVGGLVGNLVCGWACPFGWLQDTAARVPLPKFRLPAWTGWGRFLVLGLFVLAIPMACGEQHPLYFCRLCPVGALEGATPHMLGSLQAGEPMLWPNPLKITILLVVLVAMFLVHRPWCRVLCPLGAMLAVFNRFSLLLLRVRSDSCRDCGACENLCSYGALNNGKIRHESCIRCLDCIRCPAIRAECR